MTETNYADFVTSKLSTVPATGITGTFTLPPSLFGHQSALTSWALRRGRAAVFADTGLGKMRIELAWADVVNKHTRMPIMYYDTPRAPNRRRNPISRAEYQSRRTEFAPRGTDLPQTKLLALDIGTIRSAARQRECLRKHIADKLSNQALAKSFNVHVRTIEKVLARETGSHLA